LRFTIVGEARHIAVTVKRAQRIVDLPVCGDQRQVQKKPIPQDSAAVGLAYSSS
jgi:hypothetical protein